MKFGLGSYVAPHCTIDAAVSGELDEYARDRWFLVETTRHRSRLQKPALILNGPVAPTPWSGRAYSYISPNAMQCPSKRNPL